MPTFQDPDFHCSIAVPFEHRQRWKAAGFTFNSKSREWETCNPFIANGMVDIGPRLFTPFDIDESYPLFPYQVEGTQDIMRGLQGLDFHCLGDEMGLGKTPQAIRCAAELFPEGRVAVICLANARRIWHDHIYGNPDHKPHPIHKWGGTLANRDADVVYSAIDGFEHKENHLICSYTLAAKILPLAGDFDFIILDEIQSLGNPETKQTKAVLEFCKEQVSRGAKVLGLTGTWLKNCPIEVWPILHAIGPTLFKEMNYTDFARRYCNPWRHPKTKRLIVEGFRNTKELAYNLRDLCLTRRQIKEVRDDLPDPVFSHVQLEHDGTIETLLRQEIDIFDQLEKRGTSKSIKLGEYSKLRKELAEYKAPLIASYIERKVLPEVDKVCIFCHTVNLAKYLEEELKAYGAVRITGETPAKKRDDIVARFQSEESCRVFVGNIQAAGVAITLTAASTLIFAETSWVPGDNDQVIGRVRRHGQTEQVHVKFVVLRGSLDEKILSKSYWKKEGISMVLDK